MNHKDSIAFLIDLSRKAGEAILQIYNSEHASTKQAKDDGSPLTLADTASNQVILEGLSQKWPQLPIITEELAHASYDERKNWDRFWLVDPLDGTKEFLKRNGEFTTNIALIEHGVPTLGIVFAPAFDLLYWGSRELGSHRIQSGEQKQIFSSSKDPLKGLRLVESRSHGTELPESLLQRIVVTGRVPSGSSLKLCLVAEDRADFYPRLAPTMEWDVAAGDAVFRYSGNPQPRYSPLTYNKVDLRNPWFILGLEENFWSPDDTDF